MGLTLRFGPAGQIKTSSATVKKRLYDESGCLRFVAYSSRLQSEGLVIPLNSYVCQCLPWHIEEGNIFSHSGHRVKYVKQVLCSGLLALHLAVVGVAGCWHSLLVRKLVSGRQTFSDLGPIYG